MADHIRKTESGWVADFRVAGKRRQLRAKTKAEAQERMARELAELEQQPVRASAFTLEEARKLSLKVRWRGLACETTAAGYSADVVAFLGESTPLASITAQDVERLRAYLKAKGNKPATSNWKVSCLQSMLRDAQLHGHLDAVPVLPKRLRMDNQRDRVVSDLERDTFVRCLQAFGQPECADLFLFLLETGCRFSESERMTAAHVNVERQEWLIPQSKNGHKRTVLLTTKALQCLDGRLDGGKAWSVGYRKFQANFDKAKAKMGLADDLELTIHSLRHSCLSKLARAGLSLPQLQAWGGHRSLSALQRYIHLDVSSLQQARSVLEGTAVAL
jgi:integrase